MKIAFLVNSFPSVSQTFIFNQVIGLIDMGHDVEIYSTENIVDNKEKYKNEILKYNLLDNIYNIPQNKFNKIIISLFIIIKNIAKNPAIIKRLPNIKYILNIKKKYKFNILNFIYLYCNLINKKFDIIHCHFGPNGIRGVILKKLGIEGKLITTFHGYDANMYPKIHGNNIYKELFLYCDAFTSNTYYTKYQMFKLGCNKKIINILPVGVNLNKFQYQEKKLNKGDCIKFITVGRLVEKKGYDISLKAFAKLYKENQNIKYYIIGDGEKKEELYKLADKLKIQKVVKFLGSLDMKNIIEIFKESHIFLLPSKTAQSGDKEGQALVIQEAQASGIPVLSTYHNGIPEGIVNGKSGYLVKENNIDELYEGMKYMIKNSHEWKNIGKMGRLFVEKRYDINKLNNELIKIYSN